MRDVSIDAADQIECLVAEPSPSTGCIPSPAGRERAGVRVWCCEVRARIRSVWEKLIDRARAVAYIRYHIDFRACLRAWFVARLESAMETSGQDRFGADALSVGVIVSGIEPVER